MKLLTAIIAKTFTTLAVRVKPTLLLSSSLIKKLKSRELHE